MRAFGDAIHSLEGSCRIPARYAFDPLVLTPLSKSEGVAAARHSGVQRREVAGTH